eukprot:3941566-Rhodomonas_salina.2
MCGINLAHYCLPTWYEMSSAILAYGTTCLSWYEISGTNFVCGTKYPVLTSRTVLPGTQNVLQLALRCGGAVSYLSMRAVRSAQ